MAYTKRVPPIKLVVSTNEFNILVGVLTENIDRQMDDSIKELSIMTKEKLLRYSVPRKNVNGNIEIDLRLYINEVADLITLLLFYVNTKMKEIDYYQVLLKVRETMNNDDMDTV